ncbi:hypothetical protein G6F56_006506 [Rhizopus delemar]|nr:hypothetical protein G6F56_006506 [Rhizopus delemar]
MSTSPYRYNHSFTPNKEKSLGDFKDGSINVKSDVSNHTQYNSPPPLPYFTRSNSSPVNNNSKVSECLDIRHINHEAIRNDMYLKTSLGISKNPSAFNSHPDDDSFDEDCDEFDQYDELEMMVNNPALEKMMRSVAERSERLQCLQEELLFEQRHRDSPQSSLDPLSSSLVETQPLTQEIRRESFKDMILYYISKWFELIIFQFFMVYWIMKEPIIRTVTFFTMIVSALLVTPALYIFTKVFNQGIPNSDKRRRITSMCTGALFLWLLYIAYPHVKPYIPKDYWKPISSTPGDLYAIQYRISKWEDRVNQLGDKQLNHQTLYDDFSSKVNSEIQYIKDQLGISTTEILQKATNQQGDIEAIVQQYHTLIRKLNDIENNLLSVESKNREFISDSSQQKAIKSYVAEEVKGFLSQEEFKKYVSNELKGFVPQDVVKRYVLDELDKFVPQDVVKKYVSDELNWFIPQDMIKKYILDKLDELVIQETADFALESRGARVIHWMTSKTFQPMAPWLQATRRLLGLSSRVRTSPEMALQPQIYVGECWSMDGTRGDLGILLSEAIHVESITIDYPTPEIMNHNMSTAPRNIQVLGLKDYRNHPEMTTSLGLVQYDIHKNQSAQIFELESKGGAFEAVLIKILSNWGNSLHTDLYRIRIHGNPV